jgi:hypothetical protein
VGGSPGRDAAVSDRRYQSSKTQTASHCSQQNGNHRRYQETLGAKAGRSGGEVTRRVALAQPSERLQPTFVGCGMAPQNIQIPIVGADFVEGIVRAVLLVQNFLDYVFTLAELKRCRRRKGSN